MAINSVQHRYLCNNSVYSRSFAYLFIACLSHISLVSFLLDTGKHNSPSCDAAKRVGAILFANLIFIENEIKKKRNNTPDAPNNESGLIQMIRMEKSILHMWNKAPAEYSGISDH